VQGKVDEWGGSREEWGMGWRREGGREDGWEKEDNRGLRRKILTREERNQ